MAKNDAKYTILLILSGLLVLMPSDNFLFAQDTTENDNKVTSHQIWIDFYPHFFVNEKLEYYGDAGYRTVMGKTSWNRIYARPSLRYHFSYSLDIRGGIGLFYIFDKYDINQLEIRPWQGIQLKWPIWIFLEFRHLFRLEERISFLTDDWSSSFDLRFRYKLSGKIDFCDDCILQKWYVPAYAEIFLPLNDNINELIRNRGRAGLGVGYYASKDWLLEFIMNWQRSRSGPEDKLAVSDYAYQIKIKKHWKSNN